MLADLRERVVDRAIRIPAERVERAGRGDLLARVGDDVRAVAEAIVEALPPLAGATLTVVLTFVGLAAIDWRLALAGLVCVPVQVAALRWYLPRARPAYGDERIARASAPRRCWTSSAARARSARSGWPTPSSPRVADALERRRRGRGAHDPRRDRVLLAAQRRRARRHRRRCSSPGSCSCAPAS